MSVGEIQDHLHLLELYGVEVSPHLISTISEEVMDAGRGGSSILSNPCAPSFTSTPTPKTAMEAPSKKAVCFTLGVRTNGR